jgi:hypothetical protein
MPSRLAALVLAFLLSASSVSADSIDAAMREVEQLRGLHFLHEVRRASIDRSQIPDRLRQEMLRSLPYSTDDYALVLKTLRLVDPDTKDMIPKLLSLYESQVLAFYDPLTHVYYSVNQPAPAAAGQDQEMLGRIVAVHELTHALQDQRFDIGRHDDAIRSDWDESLAYHAVIEGEASLVMMASLMAKSGQKLDDVIGNDVLVTALAEAAKQQAVDPVTPRYFVREMTFPYLEGLLFVVAAYRRGGWAEMDRVYADPPRSTREIIHPQDYFARTAIAHGAPAPFRSSATPAALTTEHMGEFHWAFLVGAENAQGWKDDRVTIVQDASCQPTVLAETEWDDAAHAAVFLAAYRTFLEEQGIPAMFLQQGPRVKISYGADRELTRRWAGQS